MVDPTTPSPLQDPTRPATQHRPRRLSFVAVVDAQPGSLSPTPPSSRAGSAARTAAGGGGAGPGAGAGGDGTGARGSRTRNVAPSPGAVSSSTVPPWAAVIAATIDSPRPVPPCARLRAASVR